MAVIDSKGDQMWNGIQTGTDNLSDHWNRDNSQIVNSQIVNLLTFTNAEEVELLLNGKSLGKKQNQVCDPKQRNQIRWRDIEYQPGTLEAIARNNGIIVARHKIETTGPAVRLTAEPDLDATPEKRSQIANRKLSNSKLSNSKLLDGYQRIRL
jgi:beta-galactosidase